MLASLLANVVLSSCHQQAAGPEAHESHEDGEHDLEDEKDEEEDDGEDEEDDDGDEREVHEAHEEHVSKIIVTRPLRKDTIVTREYVCQIHSRSNIEVRALEGGYLQSTFVK